MDELIEKGYNRNICPITGSMAALGDSWSLLIVRECFLGFRRFDEFQRNLSMSKSVLTRKLKALINNDILFTRSYQNLGQRARKEYLLTDKGKELYKVIIALLEWGNQYLDHQDIKLAVFDRAHHQPAKLILKSSNEQELSRRDIRLGILESPEND